MMGAFERCAGVVGGLALLLATAPLHAGEQTIKDMPSDHVDADTVDYPTLCTHEDWVVFNAVSDVDAKLVSVCLSEGDDSYPSHLTFRYGTAEKVEFSYPEKAERSFDAFLLRRYTRPQTTYLKFEMTRDGRTYAVLAGGEGDAYSAVCGSRGKARATLCWITISS
jgi:hypothetical protein